MRKFKKSLAFALAAALVATAVPVTAQAAPTAKAQATTLYANGIAAYNTTKIVGTTGYKIRCSTKNTKLLAVGQYGTVKARAAGKVRTGAAVATVTVKIYNKNMKLQTTKNVKINVKPAAYAVSVSLDKTSVNIGDTAKATGKKATAKASSTLRYYSSNTAVATVDDKTGVITPVAAGTTNITAKATISRVESKAVALTVVADAPAASQTGTKTITVTNGVSMADKTIAVKRGNTTVNLASEDGIQVSEDGKTVVITTAAKMTDGTYTVSVGDKDLAVNATTEKVSAIRILSDKAAANQNSNPDKATVGYKVENQFGEDITKTTTVRVSGTDIATNDRSDGKVEFVKSSGTYIINRDVVSVVIIHTETGVSAQATLTISDEAAITQLTYEGVYNRDNKAFTEDEDPSDFYLLFTAKDQYGDIFKDYKNVKVGTDIYVTVAAGLTNVTAANNQTCTKITKNGVDYLGVQLSYNNTTDDKLSAGTATILAIAAGNGTNVSDNLVVASGSKVDKISVTANSDIVAGEENELEFTATDANGNAVTKYSELKDVKINGNKTAASLNRGSLYWEKDAATNNAKLIYNSEGNTVADNTTITEVVTFQTETNNVTSVQFTVRPNAKAVAIVGSKDISFGLVPLASVQLKLKNLKIEDQYGRTVKDDDLVKILDNQTINFEVDNAGFTVSNASAAITSGTTTKDTVLTTITATSTATTAKLTALINGVSGSDIDFNLVSSNVDKVSNLKVSVDKVFYQGGATYQQKVLVTGTRNGTSVLIPSSLYTVNTAGTDLALGTDTEAGQAVLTVLSTATIKAFTDDSKLTETTQKITVTLNTGDVVEADVVISNVKPVVNKINFKSDDKVKLNGTTAAAAQIVAIIESVEDTYGVEHTIVAANTTGEITLGNDSTPTVPTFTFTDFNADASNAATVSANGTAAAVLTANPDFKSCGVTIKYGTFGVSKSVVRP